MLFLQTLFLPARHFSDIVFRPARVECLLSGKWKADGLKMAKVSCTMQFKIDFSLSESLNVFILKRIKIVQTSLILSLILNF